MTVVKSKKLRDAARDQECTLRVVGICNYDPATTIHAHFPSNNAGYKPSDISGGHSCSSCHDWIDKRKYNDGEDREFYMRRSQDETIHRLIDMGIIKIQGWS